MRALVLLAGLAGLSFGLASARGASAEEPRRPSILPYTEGAPVPPGYHVGPIGYSTPFIAGLLSFWFPYFVSCIGAAIDDRGRALVIPAVGPLIAAFTHRSTNADHSGLDAVSAVYLADGAVQTIGITMIILGASLKHDVLLRNDVYPPGKEPIVKNRVVPTVAVGPGAVTLSVRF